ncbi:MAG: hypothetical protein HY000_24780 [Planctomycetes bacterium]|nr:hypothetical protein [Planctomycetota bacterium]
MIQLDYWNHPLIVKAVRVKYRGGRIFWTASSYLLLLMMGGVALHRYQQLLQFEDWARVYFIIMISVQFFIAGMIALSTTASSMQSEVTTRALDFQRIAAISPIQIVLGKVIGEPVTSYLLSMSTIPIAVLCCTQTNIAGEEVVLLYVTLATTSFLGACLGIQHTLDPTSKGANAGAVVGMLGALIIPAIGMPVAALGARVGLAGLLRALVGLLTPVFSIKGMAMPGLTIWSEQMPFFGANIPYALLTPVAQLALAALLVLFMTRRFTQPLLTSLSKLQSYAVLIVLDLLWAGLEYESVFLARGLTDAGMRYAMGHTVLALGVLSRATPGRETVQSWVWRFRGRRSLLADLWLGERSPNVLALITYSLIGPLVFGLAVAVPAGISKPAVIQQALLEPLGIAGTVSVLVILCYGVCCQAVNAAVGKGAGAIFFVSLLIGLLAPFAVGEGFGEPVITSLSPLATFIRLHEADSPPYHPAPFVAVHLAGIAFWGWGLYGMTQRTIRQVERKLDAMGVK